MIYKGSKPTQTFPTVPKLAELTPQSPSIQSLYSWCREDRLYVNRRYQRKLVWTLEEKQKLIDSILRKFPIPAILLAEKTDKPNFYEIIDGLQRLHAIVSFIEMSFPTIDGRYFNLEYFPTAKAQSDTGKFTLKNGVPLVSQAEYLQYWTTLSRYLSCATPL
jgi:hypothetical protein